MPSHPPALGKPVEFLAPMRVYAILDQSGKFRLVKKWENVDKSIGTYSTWAECFSVGTKFAAKEEQKDVDGGINAWLHRS